MHAENFCARAEENISELVFQSTDVKAMAANWSIGRNPATSTTPLVDTVVNSNGSPARSYESTNEKAKEAIRRSGKRNTIKGWPPSGPLSQ